MRIVFALLLILFSQTSKALGADDLIFQPEQSLLKPAQLTGDQVQEDLELLDLALREGYQGPSFRDSLSSLAQERTPEGLCTKLASILENVNNAHLRAYLDFKSCGKPLTPGQVGANIATGQNTWLAKKIEGITVVAIPTFWPEFDPRWNGFLDKVRELREQSQPFILDLRGNTGGDDSFGVELARILLGASSKATLPTPIAERTFKQTPAAYALQANAWAWNELKLKNQGQPIPAAMEQRRQEILSWMNRAERHEFPEKYEENLAASSLASTNVFTSKVYILIDHMCASSCENTLQVLESLPNRILVGEQTMGAVQYGEAGRVILPNSKVSITLTTMSVKFKDGRTPEKVGYTPDIQVPKNKDALSFLLKSIN